MDVAEGVWLEVRGTRLAWGASPVELRANTSPDFETVRQEDDPGAIVFSWNDRILGGLPCQIRTTFESKYWPLKALRYLHLTLWPSPAIQSFQDKFAWTQRELIDRFGEPLFTSDDGGQGEAAWQLGKVVIRNRYFDEFGSFSEVLLFVGQA
ncbi:hypothetical protein [Zavarzinella formosa]|uniref:hypothetical protein n=1 Tax=Zavarzinella formosa TaxID=360055 RepID=UPI000373B757|nr:hypothetical protein [Zavarzinella formosa]